MHEVLHEAVMNSFIFLVVEKANHEAKAEKENTNIIG
jgi:hypothetical protein